MTHLQFKSILFVAFAVIMPIHAAIYRVGVMDFSNLSENKNQDWVCEAFTSSVADKLSRLSSFSVLPRNRIWEIQGESRMDRETSPEDAQRMAEKGHLDYLVFGSVQRAGNLDDKTSQLRVHARLVDTVRGIIHQAVILDGKMSELFDLQYRLAEAFAKQATIEISVAERKAMSSPEALSLEAYRLFNIGMLEKRAKQYEKAITAFEEAMAKHPGILYGDAHHQIGLVYLAMNRHRELLTRFKADVAHLAPVYYDLGIALRHTGDYARAADAFKTFVESTDRLPFLWEQEMDVSEYDVYLDPEGFVVVVAGGERLWALDAGSGEKLWSMGQQKGATYRIQGLSSLVSEESQRVIDINSGNQISLPNEDKMNLLTTHEDQVKVLISSQQVVVKDGDRSLWVYKAHEGEEILAHNRETFLVRLKNKRLRALRVQKENLPNQVDGLLQLAQCLELDGKRSQSQEVYSYLMELEPSKVFKETSP